MTKARTNRQIVLSFTAPPMHKLSPKQRMHSAGTVYEARHLLLAHLDHLPQTRRIAAGLDVLIEALWPIEGADQRDAEAQR